MQNFTRILLGSLMLFSARYCYAQTYDTTTFAGKIGYTFSHVDKTQIHTGLLREYGIDFLDLSNYTGTSLNDSNYVGLVDWRILYASLYSQRVNTNISMLYLDTLNNLFNKYFQT